MVSTISTVECVICHKTHLETPAQKMTQNKDGVLVFGFDARDWGYYRDNWNGVYSVICKKEHDALVAPKGEVVK